MHPYGKRSAFMLVELLVVIAIIALLASLLLPGLRAAKALAAQSVCAANVRQVGTAVCLYAQDNRGFFPETTHGQAIEKSWIYTLAPYIQKVDEVRICPADPKRKERLDARLTSYILNEYIAVPYVDPFDRALKSYTNLHQLRLASMTLVAFEISDAMGLTATSDHTHGRQWFGLPDGGAWGRICQDIQPDPHRPGSAAEDHTRGAANYLYADSHVDPITAADLKEMADSEINFAKPAD